MILLVVLIPNDARLRVAGSKTGRGLSQVFAVLTATVSWLANSWDSPDDPGDSPEFTAKLLKLAPFGTTKPLANLAAMAFILIFNLCYVNCQPLSEITAHGLGPIIDRDFGQRGKGIHGRDDDNAAFGLAEPSW